MLYLVTGGSGSGKSAFAETLCVELNSASSNMYYIAHMYPYIFGNPGVMDEETKQRIDRHKCQRAGKGFETIECFCNISSLLCNEAIDGEKVLLSECMSNLLANEMYLDEGRLNSYKIGQEFSQAKWKSKIEEYIVEPIFNMSKKVKAYVVVTNEIYIDRNNEYEETIRYADYLAYINRRLTELSEKAYEVVCGIPIELKKKEEI